MIIKKFKLIVLAPLLLPMFVSCATVSNIGTDNWRDYFKPSSSKEEITRDFNLYRGKWWNYYVRGRWYADGGYYDEAIQDFKNPSASEARTNVQPGVTVSISGSTLPTVNWESFTIIRKSMKMPKRNWKHLFPPQILPGLNFI